MNIFAFLFSLLDQLWGSFNNRGSQADKRQRERRQTEKRSAHWTRGITGRPLSREMRLSPTDLDEVFLPDSQSVADAWKKLSKLNMDKTYSMILLLHWASDQGKQVEFKDDPFK